MGFDVSGLDIPGLISLETIGADWLTGGEFGLEGSAITVFLLLLITVYLTVKWHDDLNSFKINFNQDADSVA